MEETDTNLARDLRVSGLITLFVAPGITVLGIVLAFAATKEIFFIMLGVSTLIAFTGLGLLISSWAVEHWPHTIRNQSN